jgi:hypothetical protein
LFTIGKGLKVPLVSIPAEKAGEHFGMFFGHVVDAKDAAWEPTGPRLIEDLTNRKY